ncbi:N-formylglutamate amidohydrolase [Novosphingobium rosa]|uniref:N-formylglutamate amidohydrolase n=1 Tax=Novosphingobium rosa TaxID=76978 RepID=UPI0008301C56|nr:N-formylglutamate amidohydrolase [Novosphingobium rosa]
MSNTPLLFPDEAAPVGTLRTPAQGAPSGPFLLIADHAGRAIPRRLGWLGLDEADLQRHIAWDIGALAVSKHVSAMLEAPLVYQRYSRLVIDCNRQLHAHDSIPQISEYTQVPGNHDLSETDRLIRQQEIHAPYHACIADLLDRWQGPAPILVAMHSCTPRYKEQVRTMEIGCLYGDDRRFAGKVLDVLQARVGPTAVDNQPYQVDMLNDYSVPVHAEKRGLAYVEFEIRQDLIADAAGALQWARTVSDALEAARGNFV